MAPPNSISPPLFALLPVLTAVAACSAPGGAPSDGTYGRVEQRAGVLPWKGYDWNVTTGGMAGVAQGDPSNVSLDASGYLHLKITKNGTTFTAAELTSVATLGFGTYQWQIAGPIDRMDHTVVLGLAPYGPAAGIGADGYNEIDTEFSYWNDEIGHVNMDWGVYPATTAGTHQEKDFFFSLNGGNATTARMVWSKTSVVSSVFSGFVPLGSNVNQLSTYTYAPPNPSDAIPQLALPVLLNLWCYKGVPSSGNGVEVVLQDFQFVPEGQPIPGPDASTDPVDAAAPEGGDAGQAEAGVAAPDGAAPAEAGGGTPSDDASGGGGGGESGGAAGAGAPGGSTSESKGCTVSGEAGAPVDRSAPGVAVCALLAVATLCGARRRRSTARATV